MAVKGFSEWNDDPETLPPGWSPHGWANYLRGIADACRWRYPQRAEQLIAAAEKHEADHQAEMERIKAEQFWWVDDPPYMRIQAERGGSRISEHRANIN